MQLSQCDQNIFNSATKIGFDSKMYAPQYVAAKKKNRLISVKPNKTSLDFHRGKAW
jgi:hypothetical protein